MEINKDIICYLCKWLSDMMKIYFLSTCTSMHFLKNNVMYDDVVDISLIEKLPYFDNFTKL